MGGRRVALALHSTAQDPCAVQLWKVPCERLRIARRPSPRNRPRTHFRPRGVSFALHFTDVQVWCGVAVSRCPASRDLSV